MIKSYAVILSISVSALACYSFCLGQDYEWQGAPLTHLAAPVSMTTTSPDGTTHTTVADTAYTTTEGSGVLLKVDTPEESIFRSADLTIAEGSRNIAKRINADQAHLVIVKRWNDAIIEAGVGSVVQLAFMNNGYVDITGAPGTFVEIEPGASVVWNGMELSAAGDQTVGFRIGFKGDDFVMDKITGKLRFKRESPDGKITTGIIVESEKGNIIEFRQ